MCLHIKAIKNFQLLLQTKSQNESLVVFFLLFLLLGVFIEWSLGVFHVHVLNFTFIYQFYSRITNFIYLIEIINNKARHNLINVKYHQMAFRLARWCCSWEFFGNPLVKRKWCTATRGRLHEVCHLHYIVSSRHLVSAVLLLQYCPSFLWKTKKWKD